MAKTGEGSALAALSHFGQEPHARQRPDIFRADFDADELARTFESRIPDDAHLVLIAADGDPVGFLVGEWVTTDGDVLSFGASVLAIELIAVAPDHRRGGVGSALVVEALALADERRVNRVDLTVWHFNSASRQFFTSLGFETTSERMSRVVS